MMEQVFVKSEPDCEIISEDNEMCVKPEENKIEKMHSELDKNIVNTPQKTMKLNISNSLLEKIKSNPSQFHPGLTLYACGICSKLFETENHVMHHLTIMHRPVTVNIVYGAYCDFCKLILDENVYDRHLPCFRTNPKQNLSQPITNNQSKQKCDLYECIICNSKYVSEENLTEHLRLIHRPITINFRNTLDIIFCDTCKLLYRDNTYIDHHPCCAVDFKCSFCLTTMPLKSHYWSHDLIWCGTESFQCKICAVDTTHYSISQLNEHIMTHNELGVFKCVRCVNHYFPNADDLEYHILLFHNGCRCFHSFCRCSIYTEEFYNTKILNRNSNVVCEPKTKLENTGFNEFNSEDKQYSKITRIYPNKTKSIQLSSNNKITNYEQNSSKSVDIQQDISQFLLSDIIKEEHDIFAEESKHDLLENVSSETNNQDFSEKSFIYHNLDEEICIDLDPEDPSEDPLNILNENEENCTYFPEKPLKRGRGRPRKYNTKKNRIEWLRMAKEASTREGGILGLETDQHFSSGYCADLFPTPKYPVERVREYRSKNRTNKQTKNQSKTEAESHREYRARKNTFIQQNQTYLSSTSFLLNETDGNLNCPGPSRINNLILAQHNSFPFNNEFEEEQTLDNRARPRKYKKNPPKTAAERVREYRARKNAMKIKNPPKTGAERNREYRARKNTTKIENPINSENSSKTENTPKTSAERGREYRARKRALKIKKPPKSPAERTREYRERKKFMQQNQPNIDFQIVFN